MYIDDKKILTVEETEMLTQAELTTYMASLTPAEKNQLEAEFNLKALRHFANPDHCYETSGLRMSRQQYQELEAYILLRQTAPVENRKARRAEQAQARKGAK